MRSIEIWSSPELWGGTLGGIIRLEPGASIEEEAAELAVLVFVWSTDTSAPGIVRGWQALSLTPYPTVAADGTWTVPVPPSPQYAASLVSRYFILGPDPMEPEQIVHVVGPGTLLDPDVYPTAITTPVKNRLQILSAPDDDLTGAVLGVSCGVHDIRLLRGNRVPLDSERFRLVAWAIYADDTVRPIGETRCESGGYWAFPPLDARARDASRYAVALVTNTYVPGPQVPEAVPDTEVMAVAFREHTQRPPHPPSPSLPPTSPTSPRARAAGRGLKPPGPEGPKGRR